MKTYNYYYNGQPIPKSQFLSIAPENWESNLDEYGEFSFGYYRAVLNDLN